MINKDMMIMSLAVNQFLNENGIDIATVEDIEIDYKGLDEKNLVTIGNLTFSIMKAEDYVVEKNFHVRFNGGFYQELGKTTTCGYHFVCFKDKVMGA